MLLHQNNTILEKAQVVVNTDLWDEVDDMGEFAENHPEINRNYGKPQAVIIAPTEENGEIDHVH